MEPTAGHPDLSLIARDIVARVRAGAGVAIHECLFVEQGVLPKTPSGKVRRFQCKEMAAGGTSAGVRIRS